jgi:hypothetical protein
MSVLNINFIYILPLAISLFLFFLYICLKPKLFFYLLTFLVFFQYVAYETPYQKYFTFWDDILLLIFIIVVIIKVLVNGKFKTTQFDKYIFLFLVISIISMILNHSPVLPSLYGIKNYLQYAIMFLCIINIELKEETIRKILNSIFLVFILQIPFVVYQIRKVLSINGTINVDDIFGTFPGANNLSYATLFPIFLLIGKIDFRFKKITDIVVFLILLFLLVIGQGRLGIFLFLLVLIYIYKKQILLKFSTKGFKLMLIFLLFVVGIIIYFYVNNKSINDMLRNFDILYQFSKAEFDVYSGSQRYLYYPLTWRILKDNGVLNLLFGLGPVMYGSYAGFKFMTPYTKYLSNVFGQLDKGFDPYVSSQIIPIWGEVGFLGLIVYFIILYKIFKFARFCFKNYDDPLIKSLSCGLIAGSFLMIIGSFFQQVFETQVLAYPYWLITGLLLKLIKERENLKYDSSQR